MAKPFSGATPNFAPADDGDDRYARARAGFQDLLRQAAREKAAWRTMAFASLAVTVVLAGGIVYMLTTRTVETHVIEVDRTTGELVRQVALSEPLQPSDALIAGTLARWIQMTRGKSVDPLIIKQSWQDAYSFVAQKAKPQVDQYARDLDPFANIGSEARTVDVRSITRQSGDTFQARWIETTYKDGRPLGTKSYTGNFTIKVENPRNPRDIFVNPVGLYITALYVQPDFEGRS